MQQRSPPRRRLLQLLGGVIVTGLAGCTTDLPLDESGNEGNTAGDSPNQATEQAKLTAADGDAKDLFGQPGALAANGATALIAAQHDEDPNGENAGSAYVFERTGDAWDQQAKLAADDGDSGDVFGSSVALSADGTTALVGASRHEDPDGQTGAVYVFARTGDNWNQRSTLTARDGSSRDSFGSSVTLARDGTTALVGAGGDTNPNGENAGSVYVFSQTGDTWNQETKLVPNDGDQSDFFGSSLALDGDTALVGAWLDDDPNGENAGSAYVFERTGDSWNQETKLTADDGDSGDVFGVSVALASDGGTALVGAPKDNDPNGENAGSAYVFEQAGGTWRQQRKLTADDGDSGDELGVHIALAADGTTALVTASADEDPNGEHAGSAYVFERTGETWNQRAKLAGSDGSSRDFFGSSAELADDGATALLGAFKDDDPNGENAGSAYVYSL